MVTIRGEKCYGERSLNGGFEGVETQTSLVFITGGVRSGKSSYAERKAIQIVEDQGGQLHYIATGEISDEEMKNRIAIHRRERSHSNYNWRTWEQPLNLKGISSFFKKEDVILVDCLTTLLNNELFSQHVDWEDERDLVKIKGRVLEGIFEISKNAKTLIVVSNEVVFEPIHSSLVYTYGKLLGELHQVLVEHSNQAYLVEVGIPILKKGE